MDRIVVLGGGVIGLAIARELAGRGLRVTLLEARRTGAGASRAAVGVLSAPTGKRSAFARLGRRGYEAFPGLSAELLAETGVDVGYRECGCVHLLDPTQPDGGATLAPRIAAWTGGGVAVRRAGRKELEELIPGLGPGYREGVVLDRESIVHPGRLVEALRLSAARRGVDVREEVDQREALDVRERADLVVVACGAWSDAVAASDIASSAGASLRLAPVRGQALEACVPAPGCVVHFAPRRPGLEYYLVPRQPGRVWIGSTVEDAGFDDFTTAQGKAELVDAARAVLPGLGAGAVVRHWAGLRPKALRPGGPFLGPLAASPRIWMACGHYRSGILTAPATAELLAGAICDGAELPRVFAP